MKRKEKKYKEAREVREEEESRECRKVMAAAISARLDTTGCKV
jgi:hypothetical protein